MLPILSSLIKALSIVLITGAIGLELWHLQALVIQSQPPAVPSPILGFARFALIAHGLEGMIAAVYAPRRQRQPFSYAIYTFFVGTIGLVELFKSDKFSKLP